MCAEYGVDCGMWAISCLLPMVLVFVGWEPGSFPHRWTDSVTWTALFGGSGKQLRWMEMKGRES